MSWLGFKTLWLVITLQNTLYWCKSHTPSGVSELCIFFFHDRLALVHLACIFVVVQLFSSLIRSRTRTASEGLVVHYQWPLLTLAGLSKANDLLLGGVGVRGLYPRDPAACLLNLCMAAELLPARAHLPSQPAVWQPSISLGLLWPLDYWLYEPLCWNEGLGSRINPFYVYHMSTRAFL